MTTLIFDVGLGLSDSATPSAKPIHILRYHDVINFFLIFMYVCALNFHLNQQALDVIARNYNAIIIIIKKI